MLMCEEITGAQRTHRKGGWRGNERSKLNLRRGPQGAICRVCASRGKSQRAVHGTEHCRHHGGLWIATNKGTRQPPRNRETLIRRGMRRALKAEPPPAWVLRMPIWSTICKTSGSLAHKYRLALAALALDRGDDGAAEAWVSAIAAAREFLAGHGAGHGTRGTVDA